MNRVKYTRLAAIFIAMALTLPFGCSSDSGDDDSPDGTKVSSSDDGGGSSSSGGTDGIVCNSVEEPNGTLTVLNNINKDVILFQGQTPTSSNIIGCVQALSPKTFNISDAVDDFHVGGYMILRGITKDEYEANKTDLSKAKVEFSAMATYGQGRKFRTEISPNYMGDFGYKVNNIGRIGMELRKNSPDGEKVAYLASLEVNRVLYNENSNALALFPVFVYYSKTAGTVTTLKAIDQFATVTITPRPIANASGIQSYTFPNDETVTWQQIVASLTSPVAYIKVINNVPNQGGFFTVAGSNALMAQNGYDAIGSGEQLTYEIESTEAGAEKNLVANFYSGAIKIPVKFAEVDGNPVIKNGYDYTITINFKGGSVQELGNYEALIVEHNKRDLTNEIESL
ncbi:MAG: hypothetical protein LBU89_00355 [Fibromonadaceae bacterium]|jgi:hypothetical protein|nr:hypothetical protein [Fibromonadaceae bacterium]